MSTINFPNPEDYSPEGLTCEIYSFGWTSGCTDEYYNNKGFTQEWFFENRVGAWISSTENYTFPTGDTGDLVFLTKTGSSTGLSSSAKLNFDKNELSIEGTVSKKIKTHLIHASAIPGITTDISFLDSDIHHVTFSGSGGIVNLNIINSSDSGYFSEMSLIIKNAAAPASLNIRGNNGSSSVKMDEPGIDTLVSSKTYMWKIWTIDGGSTYYVYRANGYGRYWR